MRKLLLIAFTLLSLAVITAPTFAQKTPGTIWDIIVARATDPDAPEFTTLHAAVKAARLESALSAPGLITLFAPTDAAFAEIPPRELELLLADQAALTKLLTYHVVPELVTGGQIPTRLFLPTVEGEDLAVVPINGFPFINSTAGLVSWDTQASNGVIHTIDDVLIPPYVDPSLSDMWLAVRDTYFMNQPNGIPRRPTRVLRACKTIILEAYTQGFILTRDLGGGWINVADLQDVAEDYGLPGGTPIVPECEGK